MIKQTICALMAAGACTAYGSDLSNVQTISQDQFHDIAEDLGAAFSYKGVTPATPLGPLGFDIGVELTSTQVKNSSAFSAAGAGSTSDLFIPKIHIYKGLGWGIDIGGFVGGSSTFGATLVGLDVSYAFVDDTLTTPAVGVRLSGTRALDMGDLSLDTVGLDLLVSKKANAVHALRGCRCSARLVRRGQQRSGRREVQQGSRVRRAQHEPDRRKPCTRVGANGIEPIAVRQAGLAFLKSRRIQQRRSAT